MEFKFSVKPVNPNMMETATTCNLIMETTPWVHSCCVYSAGSYFNCDYNEIKNYHIIFFFKVLTSIGLPDSNKAVVPPATSPAVHITLRVCSLNLIRWNKTDEYFDKITTSMWRHRTNAVSGNRTDLLVWLGCSHTVGRSRAAWLRFTQASHFPRRSLSIFLILGDVSHGVSHMSPLSDCWPISVSLPHGDTAYIPVERINSPLLQTSARVRAARTRAVGEEAISRTIWTHQMSENIWPPPRPWCPKNHRFPMLL